MAQKETPAYLSAKLILEHAIEFYEIERIWRSIAIEQQQGGLTQREVDRLGDVAMRRCRNALCRIAIAPRAIPIRDAGESQHGVGNVSQKSLF